VSKIIIDSDIPELQPFAQDELVRIGRDNDGGYVVSKIALENSDVLFSGGYGNDFSFENAFVSRFPEKKAVIFDYSITIVSLCRGLFGALLRKVVNRPHYPIDYYFRNLRTYFLLKFAPRVRLVHAMLTSSQDRKKPLCMNLERAFQVASGNSDSQLYCKLDIEGSEYELVGELVSLQSRISGMVIEFHDTFHKRKEFLESLKLLDECYVNTHTHVNNYGGVGPDSQPVVYEISFLNKRLWDGARSNGTKNSWVTSDQPNNPQQPEIVLNFS
jgi:hypothetical protein